MFKFVKAELYKFLYRPYMYVTLSVFIFLIASVLLFVNKFPIENTRQFILENAVGFFKSILIFMITFTVAFYEEFKDGTLKNVVSSGLSREKIFIGKFIVEAIQAFIIAIISMAIFLAGIYIFTKPCAGNYLSLFLVKFLAAIPLFLGALAFINVLIMLIKKEGVMTFSYLAIILSLPKIIDLLQFFIWDKFSYIGDILLTTQISKLEQMQTINGDMLMVALVGIIHTIIFTAIGIMIFKKKEIM